MTTKRITLTLVVSLLTVPAQAEGPARVANPRAPTLISGATKQRAGASIVGQSGATWLLPGGPVIRAESGSSLRVLRTPQPLTLGPGRATAGYTVVFQSGTLSVEIPDAARSAVVLVGPRRLAAIVKSGTTSIVSDSDATAIANQDGELSTSQGGSAYKPLPAGKVLALTRNGNELRDLAPPPRWISGRRVVMAPLGSAAVNELRWEDVAAATGYRVEVIPQGEDTAAARADTLSPKLGAPLGDLLPGKYVVRVHARDPSGLLSEKALEAPVHVLGCELPDGAYVDERGTLRLGKDQTVRFVGVEGLEMTYSAGGTFARAAGTIGLYRNAPTTAFFRFPKSHDLTSIRMAPRDLKARVELGPRTATWPKDTIRIRIRAESATGEQVPDWLELTPKVMLGLKELDVRFSQKGQWLEASLPPRSGRGPWVVRVEVADQFGNPLGRDFLEVIRTPPERKSIPTAEIPSKLTRR